MCGAREAPVPRDSLNFRRPSLLSRNEFESGTFTIVLHATSFFTYVSVIYGANFPFKPGLQHTQETGAKPRDFARTQAKKCLQSMRVCLQNFPLCVTLQLVAQTTKECDHSFTVEFTTHKCTSTEKNKMALVCKRKDRIGFRFSSFGLFVILFFLLLFFSHFFEDCYCREND